MDKYPLHRKRATVYNGTSKRIRYERSTVYPLPLIKKQSTKKKSS